MAEELDYKTFDLGAVLAGRDYPEDTVEVYFNEKLGFTISKTQAAVRLLSLQGKDDEAAELQKGLDELIQKVEGEKYIAHLKGIPTEVKENILKQVRKEHPSTKTPFGVEEDNPEADALYTQRLWAAVITKFVDPSGAVSLMSEDLAASIKKQAPETAQAALTAAVRDITQGTTAKAGFEYAAQEAAFLSIASPEG